MYWQEQQQREKTVTAQRGQCLRAIQLGREISGQIVARLARTAEHIPCGTLPILLLPNPFQMNKAAAVIEVTQGLLTYLLQTRNPPKHSLKLTALGHCQSAHGYHLM